MIAVAVLFTALSYLHKRSCFAPILGTDGSPEKFTTRVSRTACYSDTLTLFDGRELGRHIFPYVHGWYTDVPKPAVHGGTVEYPTLSGIWVWFSALPVSSPLGFLAVTALTFIPLVVITVLCLQRVAGRRAWIYAATPPLLIYALYNWDVLPVAMTTIGLTVALAGPRRWSPLTRAVIAAVAFGIGGAFKLYPVMFAAPLALRFILDRSTIPLSRRWLHALAVAGAAAAAILAANVPFMLINFDGWYSVFQFQAQRTIDASTQSIWYWGLLPWSSAPTGPFQQLMTMASTTATAVSILAVLTAAVIIAKRTGKLPWVGAAAALLCVYMVFNKVNSPQYVLWLLPFFAVLRIRWTLVLAYLLADLATFIGFYRWVFYMSLGNQDTTWANQLLTVGVWGRAALLIVLVFVFFAAAVVQRHDEPAHPSRAGLPHRQTV
jgi:uncharacterized membrane protein